MMTKGLKIIAFAMLGMLCASTSSAKVCNLGDTSPDCDPNYVAGTSIGACGAGYSTCTNPRAGATYCLTTDSSGSPLEIKYTNENCCSYLSDPARGNAQYKECNPNINEVGYGKSCLGAADNKKYWEHCGCAYGFSQQNSGMPDYEDINAKTISDEKGRDPIRYLDRCGLVGSSNCRLYTCNSDRRFSITYSGDYCKYRLATRCGGFGCMQVYDCNHDNVGGDEYYRNESISFLEPLPSTSPRDYWSNETDSHGNPKVYIEKNGSQDMEIDNDRSYFHWIFHGTRDGAYNLTNKLVCSYEQGNGGGLTCGDTADYCYLWNGCNTGRRWYGSNDHMGVLYRSLVSYTQWKDRVERDNSYAAGDGFDYNGNKNTAYNDGLRRVFFGLVNPGYGVYSGDDIFNPITNSICEETGADGTDTCRIVSRDHGCTYLSYDCHQDDDRHRCYKHIACAEENRFYYSFVNAARESRGDAAENNLYETSINSSLYAGLFYNNLDNNDKGRKVAYPACIYEINACNDTSAAGINGGGCYRKDKDHQGCIEDFEDEWIRPTVEGDWLLWFNYIKPVCNDATSCYKATSCDISIGAYSSAPNTSFFFAINSNSNGRTSGMICYRGQECHIDAGAYTSTPNTSFFYSIKSLASGSTCYRGQSCHIKAGAYTSTPNTAFFHTISSKASGSTAYRAIDAQIIIGAYTSTPNTSFFDVIKSLGSGSTAYRARAEHVKAGAYRFSPNTSFFHTIDSLASGSIAYRADDVNIEGGAYRTSPNTRFFITIQSLASGSEAYRSTFANIKDGAYSSTPNTSFFRVVKSLSSGSIAYRADLEHVEAGAYSFSPNTSFFITVNSLASGSTAYRAIEGHFVAGAYSSTPNTSFFVAIESLASGSICYRGQECYIEAGAYTSMPNTSFFRITRSLASGSICYRGILCQDLDAGAYTASPNTDFFDVIKSLASGSHCYRGQNCAFEAGAYSSEPNTSFFITSHSSASGSTCYRGEGCRIEAGAYEDVINEEFFFMIESESTGYICYRGQECHIENGAYSSAPNTVFFNTVKSLGSSSTCYRGEECAETANADPNTSFFAVVDSAASGSLCYRSSSCHWNAGAYSSAPNTSFFITINSTNAVADSTCYRGEDCHIAAGAYSSAPNTSFFQIINSKASGSISYRAIDTHVKAGAYTSTPNTSFFDVIKSLSSGSIAYRAKEEHINAGAYSSTPNTSFFVVINSLASGSISYRATEITVPAGAYSSTPNTWFFHTIASYASGSISYRADRAADTAYSEEPNTSFFLGIFSYASGSKAYRSTEAHIKAGAYSSTPNTSFFHTIKSDSSGSIAYRADRAHIEAGAYSSYPNTTFFHTISSKASGSIAYRADRCMIEIGTYCDTPNVPNIDFFETISSHASGHIAYRAIGENAPRGAYSSAPNTSFFMTIRSLATGSIAYRGSDIQIVGGAYSFSPNTSFFHTIMSLASNLQSFRADSINVDAGAYTSTPNEVFFEVHTSYASGSTCYRSAGCSETANDTPNTSFFVFVDSAASGEACYRSSACNFEVGAYSSTPNTSFFVVQTATNAVSDSTCYRGEGCHIVAGAYSSTPNTDFFTTISSEASGSIVYRADDVNISGGAYGFVPNTSFFHTVWSLASGSIAYRADGSHIPAGAYSSHPNLAFFRTISSLSSGLISYRADHINDENGAYTSVPNTSFFVIITSYASGSVSYRGIGGREGSYTSSPNTSFFEVIYSEASGLRTYRVEKEHIPAGAYSSAPNTDFFHTISSYASGSISYRADKASIENEAYTIEPNPLFFQAVESHASGSTAYRASGVNEENGAYSSSPNTSFFHTISSYGSGSWAYRADEAHIPAGAYSSHPNTDFFHTIASYASGSISYRADKRAPGTNDVSPNTSFFIVGYSLASGSIAYRGLYVNIEAGAYSSRPNTSFFFVIHSEASGDPEFKGSISYRAERAHIEAGAYTSSPNTSFFITTSSHASGSIAYRGDKQHFAIGAYSSTPNTSFFIVINSLASGKTSFRVIDYFLSGGAYTSSPNTSFFAPAKSLGSGLTSYRGDNPHIPAGAYGFSPNTSFFFTISSEASGTTVYRAYEYRPEIGGYTTTPNATFFNVATSYASGSTCYRGQKCATSAVPETLKNDDFFVYVYSIATTSTCFRSSACNANVGAYTSQPNADFFNVLTSQNAVADSTCYRGGNCAFNVGAYSSAPNTSFFNIVYSIASSSICYRGTDCRVEAGAYSSKPDTDYFDVITSATSTTCYRGQGCALNVGAYSSTPNTSFFNTAMQTITSSDCYRALDCARRPNPDKGITTDDYPYAGLADEAPEDFFSRILSQSSGITCYRATACSFNQGAYSSEPNTSFFITDMKSLTQSDCYRATNCHEAVGAYGSVSTAYFNTIVSKASLKNCYRATACNTEGGAYTSTPNTSFFRVQSQTRTDITCYRTITCAAKAYSSDKINTSFFLTVYSVGASGSGTSAGPLYCYRSTACNEDAGAYVSASQPSDKFFDISNLEQSGSTCYRATACKAGQATDNPDGDFFSTVESTASGSTCYRATACNETGGAFTVEPNDLFFITQHKALSDYDCYRATACNIPGGAYTATPNAIFFAVTTSEGSSELTCYRGDNCAEGAYTSSPSTQYFNVVSSKASGKTCYRVCMPGVPCPDACAEETGAYSSIPNTLFFSANCQTVNGAECCRANGCRAKEGNEYYGKNPQWNTSYFVNVESQASGYTCYRAEACNVEGGAYTSTPNTLFFNVGKQDYHTTGVIDLTCYRGTACKPFYAVNNKLYVDTYFTYDTSSASGNTCYKPNGCRDGVTYQYEDDIVPDAISHCFTMDHQGPLNGVKCYYPIGCEYFKEGDSALCLFDETHIDTCNSDKTGPNEDGTGTKTYSCRYITEDNTCSEASRNINTQYFVTASVDGGGKSCNYAATSQTGYCITEYNPTDSYFKIDKKSTAAFYRGDTQKHCNTMWAAKIDGCADDTYADSTDIDDTYFTSTTHYASAVETASIYTISMSSCKPSDITSCTKVTGCQQCEGNIADTITYSDSGYIDSILSETDEKTSRTCSVFNCTYGTEACDTNYFGTTYYTAEYCGTKCVKYASMKECYPNSSNKDNDVYQYYTKAETPHECGTSVAYDLTGCDESKGAHNAHYAELLSDSLGLVTLTDNNGSIVSAEDIASYATTYGDIFDEGELETKCLSNGHGCIVSCSCKGGTSGWFSSNSDMINYVSATSTREYANGNPTNKARVTCYHELGCPDGYFTEEEINATNEWDHVHPENNLPYTEFYNFAKDSTNGCYYITGCKYAALHRLATQEEWENDADHENYVYNDFFDLPGNDGICDYELVDIPGDLVGYNSEAGRIGLNTCYHSKVDGLYWANITKKMYSSDSGGNEYYMTGGGFLGFESDFGDLRFKATGIKPEPASSGSCYYTAGNFQVGDEDVKTGQCTIDDDGYIVSIERQPSGGGSMVNITELTRSDITDCKTQWTVTRDGKEYKYAFWGNTKEVADCSYNVEACATDCEANGGVSFSSDTDFEETEYVGHCYSGKCHGKYWGCDRSGNICPVYYTLATGTAYANVTIKASTAGTYFGKGECGCRDSTGGNVSYGAVYATRYLEAGEYSIELKTCGATGGGLGENAVVCKNVSCGRVDGCPDDYPVEDEPDSNYFTYEESSESEGCYKITGCKYGPRSTYCSNDTRTVDGVTCARPDVDAIYYVNMGPTALGSGHYGVYTAYVEGYGNTGACGASNYFRFAGYPPSCYSGTTSTVTTPAGAPLNAISMGSNGGATNGDCSMEPYGANVGVIDISTDYPRKWYNITSTTCETFTVTRDNGSSCNFAIIPVWHSTW